MASPTPCRLSPRAGRDRRSRTSSSSAARRSTPSLARPAIRSDRIAGMLFELTEAELAATDAYESAAYARIEVRLESGRSRSFTLPPDRYFSALTAASVLATCWLKSRSSWTITTLPLLVDDIGGAGGDPGMRGPGDVIGLLGRRRGGRDREGAAAFLDREILQRREIVGRHADDLSAGFLEVADRFAERMGLGGAARGEGLGEEIEDHRPLAELLRRGEA